MKKQEPRAHRNTRKLRALKKGATILTGGALFQFAACSPELLGAALADGIANFTGAQIATATQTLVLEFLRL